MMRTYVTIVCLLCLVAVAGVVIAAPADRFKGAGYDGYDRNSYIQTSTDYDVIYARFKGASHDGYDRSIVEDIRVAPPCGTVITIR